MNRAEYESKVGSAKRTFEASGNIAHWGQQDFEALSLGMLANAVECDFDDSRDVNYPASEVFTLAFRDRNGDRFAVTAIGDTRSYAGVQLLALLRFLATGMSAANAAVAR